MNFINNQLTQHVSGTIMPIFRSVRPYTAAYGFQHLMLLAGVLRNWDAGSVHSVEDVTQPSRITSSTHPRLRRVTSSTKCTLPASWPPKTPASNIRCWKTYAAIYSLALLKMGIMVPETCWVNWLLIKFIIVASSWSYLSVPYSQTGPVHSLTRNLIYLTSHIQFPLFLTEMSTKKGYKIRGSHSDVYEKMLLPRHFLTKCCTYFLTCSSTL